MTTKKKPATSSSSCRRSRTAKRAAYTAAVFTAAFSFSPAAAADVYANFTPATPCEQHFASYEREHDLPDGILRAVATHESGKYIQRINRKAAWPWTINAAGKGFYFSSKEDALTAVDMHKNTLGVRSIDIGCMQVNMLYHGDAFDNNPRKAMNPEANIRYGARFLRARYDISESWEDAIGAYHNFNKDIGRKYAARIFKTWKKQQPDFSYGYLAKHERYNTEFTDLMHKMAPRAVSEVAGVTLSALVKFYGKGKE